MPDNRSKAAMDYRDLPKGQGRALVLSGAWMHETLADVSQKLYAKTPFDLAQVKTIDLSAVTELDTSGAWLIKRLGILASAQNQKITIENASPRYAELLAALPDTLPEVKTPKTPRSMSEKFLGPIGKMTMDLWADLVAAMFILGSTIRGAQLKRNRHGGVSIAAIVNQIDHMGFRAVPIILLMSFLIGAIIAQQGAFQLRYFGAEVFVVDLVGILQLREIGVLLTAIMIAGRSGSAITAEIGSMKMREEVDALKVIGLNPVGVLVFPRLIALGISLPLLTILANFAALAGAAVVAELYSGITFAVFLTRLQQAIDITTIAAGMIKAPFMALIIGVVAAVEGMKTGGSAESLGRRVTASVVKSIFVVILIDGLFAMFYAAIDF